MKKNREVGATCKNCDEEVRNIYGVWRHDDVGRLPCTVWKDEELHYVFLKNGDGCYAEPLEEGIMKIFETEEML